MIPLKNITRLSEQRGYLALLAVLMVAVIGFLGSTISSIFTDSMTATLNASMTEKAYFIAQAGTEEASRYVLQKGVACASVTGNADLTNVSFGGGQFTVTGTATVVSSTANGAIGSGDTSIVLASATGFASSGIVTIDSEVMSYAGVSGNTLTNVSRGIFSTTAAAHSSGAAVSENQCALNATAGVPSIASPIAQNQILKIIPLFISIGGITGWAAGDVVNGNYIMAKWNGSSWSAYTLAATGNPAAAYGLGVISFANVWMVGDKGNFYNWNGSSWSLTNVSAASLKYWSMSCGSVNDCHVASDRSGNTPGLVDWNSSSGWQSAGTILGVKTKTNLKAVSCTSASNCWAVGASSSGKTFYQWNGSNWTGSTNTLTGYTYNGLFCNSVTDCWAVGANAMFARYDGTTWSDYATGLPATQYNAIFCNSSSDCWAVGQVNSSRDLIVHWDGVVWSRDASSPTPLANLNSVSCASSTNCWAVGKTSSGNNPIFVQWNGTAWANVTVSGMATGGGLNAVTFGGGSGISIPSNSGVVIQQLA